MHSFTHSQNISQKSLIFIEQTERIWYNKNSHRNGIFLAVHASIVTYHLGLSLSKIGVGLAKTYFWLNSQGFENLYFGNLDLFSLPQNVVFRGI